jgi:hypothetical protein
MLERLLEINREAFAARHYEVAYHLLMAALHLVDHVQDRKGLEQVARAAAAQGAAMQEASSLYRLYDTLRLHLDAVRLRMDAAAQIAGRSGAPAP